MNRKLRNIENIHNMIFDKIGIKENEYHLRVGELIELYKELSKEVNLSEKDRFARELYNLQTRRTN